MFGRHDSDVVDGGTAHTWSWLRSDRARRRERERDEALQKKELRWQWHSACSGTALAPMIYTPSGPARAVPVIGQIDLGPPVTFTVRMRPGQTISDFVAAAPSIAPTLGVAELEVIPIAPQWLRIVLVPARLVSVPRGPSGLAGDEWRFGT